MLNIYGNGTKYRWYNLDTYEKSQQLATLTLAVFFFFGLHNLLQEAIMNLDGFTFAVMLVGYYSATSDAASVNFILSTTA